MLSYAVWVVPHTPEVPVIQGTWSLNKHLSSWNNSEVAYSVFHAEQSIKEWVGIFSQ